MAKRKSKKRHYRGYVQAPFGFIKPLQGSVDGTDVLVGAVMGLVGGGVVKGLLTKALGASLASLPAFVTKAIPGLSSVGVGVLAYQLQKKSNRAKGHLVGASATGAVLVTWDMLKGTDLGAKLGLQGYVQVPGLSDYYPQYNGYGSYNGVIVDNPAAQLQGFNGYGGVIVDNPAARLEALSMSAMEHDSYDGMGISGVP